MLSVEEAQDRVLSVFERLPDEPVELLDALGRALAEEVVSGLDIPPHDNSAMDGYAVRAADTRGASEASPRRLRIVSDVAAGYVSARDVEPGTAIRIMTGAPVPRGGEAVIQVELTERVGDEVLVRAEVEPGANIRRAGEDVRASQRVLSAGTQLRPAEVGVLASLGLREVRCVRRPRVGILATGDELVEPGEPLAPGKIYNANAYSTAAQTLEAGGEPVMLGIARDTREHLKRRLDEALARKLDLLVSSGGVSVGDFDLVKDMLSAEGQMDFWQVNMKPGKPLAFGSISGVPLLGLPGNPVSSMVSFELFARPAIRSMLGLPLASRREVEAEMCDHYRKTDSRRHYVRVRVEGDADSGYRAYLTGEQGSGILTSLTRGNGLAIVPEDWPDVRPGRRVRVRLLE